MIEDVGDNATQGPGRYLLNGTNLRRSPNTQNLQARRRGVRTMIGPYTMFYNSGGTSTEQHDPRRLGRLSHLHEASRTAASPT